MIEFVKSKSGFLLINFRCKTWQLVRLMGKKNLGLLFWAQLTNLGLKIIQNGDKIFCIA